LVGQLDVHCVRPLHRDNPWILPNLPFKYTIPLFHRIDLRGPALEQAVVEPADVRPQIRADEAADVHAEDVQRMVEFLSRAGNELSHRKSIVSGLDLPPR